MADGDEFEIHWYCPCGLTRQVTPQSVAEAMQPAFTCKVCGQVVGPVYESEELIRHEVEGDQGGC